MQSTSIANHTPEPAKDQVEGAFGRLWVVANLERQFLGNKNFIQNARKKLLTIKEPTDRLMRQFQEHTSTT